MTRRFLAFVLAFLMLFSSMPVQAFATTDSGETVSEGTMTPSEGGSVELSFDGESEDQPADGKSEEEPAEGESEEQPGDGESEEEPAEGESEEQPGDGESEEEPAEDEDEEQPDEDESEEQPSEDESEDQPAEDEDEDQPTEDESEEEPTEDESDLDSTIGNTILGNTQEFAVGNALNSASAVAPYAFDQSTGYPTDLNNQVWLAVYDGTLFPGEPAWYAPDNYTFFNGSFNSGMSQYASRASSVFKEEILDSLTQGPTTDGVMVWGYYSATGAKDFFLDNSPLLDRSNEEKIITAIKGRNADVDKYEVIWYVIKFQTDTYWHIDGLLVEKETYNVNYYGNGNTSGGAPNGTTGLHAGDIYTVLDNIGNLRKVVDDQEHTFIGWNTQPDGNGTHYDPDDQITITGNVSLYAQWEPPYINVDAAKVWEDDHDRDGKRPASVTAELIADGVPTGKQIVMSDGNSWTAQWFGVPKYNSNGTEIVYSVQEVDVPEGYTVTYSTDEGTNLLVITNTHTIETTSITANKAWVDNNNQDGIRPDSVTLTIYADGISTGKTVTLTAEGGWTATVDDLPKNANGEAIVYTLVEEAANIPTGYTPSTSGTTVTNTHTPETTEVSFSKTWADNEDQDGVRPDSITVRLLADGVEVQSKVVTLDDNWHGSFTGLPKHKNGTEIKYTVTEDAVEHYSTAITGDAANGYVITNTHTPETAAMSVSKVWDDKNNQDGVRGDSVTVVLYDTTMNVKATVVLNEANNWTASFGTFPKYADGEPIIYTVAETGMTRNGQPITVTESGYTVQPHEYNNADGSVFWTAATVINKYDPEVVSRNVQKSWADSDNQDGVRPASITVELQQKIGEDDEWTSTGKTAVLTATGENKEWEATFENLPKYSGGQLISYRIVETTVPTGYTVSNKVVEDVTYITNTYTPAETSVTVFKEWNDGNNQDGLRPASVTVTLDINGVTSTDPDHTVVLSEANSWTHTWTGLDKNHAGTPIVYTVTEAAVANYTPSVDRTVSEAGVTTLKVTNSHTPATTSVSFTKVWSDNHDQDGKRPDSVTVTLYQKIGEDGEVTSTGKTLEATAATNWGGTFADLPKYAAGKEITYTVDEVTVPEGYTKTVSGTTITNSRTPETTSVEVTKTWLDNNDQDGKRPASIQFLLYANNVPYDSDDSDTDADVFTMTPDDSGNWSYTITNLPKYAAGKEISYTISEVTVGNGYTSQINGTAITNTRTPDTTSVSVSKVWDDEDNQDGKRPAEIVIRLLADGAEVAHQSVYSTNGWKASFTNLPKYKNGVEIVYTVTEDEVADYTTAIVDNKDGTFTVTNTHTPSVVSIPVVKEWKDNDDQDGLRPYAIDVIVTGSNGYSATITLEDGAWSHTISNLPEYANGTKITYTVAEAGYYMTADDLTNKILTTGTPTGYTSSVSGYTITNTHEPATVSVPVSKEWDDANDQDGKRPASVTVRLNKTVNGVTTEVTSKVLESANLWKHTFENLPQYENGALITYTLSEDAVTGYTTNIDQETGKITNTHVPEAVTIVVKKEWAKDSDAADLRPDKIYLHLLASGNHLFENPQEVTVNDDGSWTHTWTTGPDGKPLPKYADGQLIRYTVTEEDTKNIEGVNYSTTYDQDITTEDGKTVITETITNTLTPGKTAITVEKLWIDTYNQDGLRPVSVFVKLYEAYKQSDGIYTDPVETSGRALLELSPTNGWIGSFTELPLLTDTGAEIKYSVKEVGYYLTEADRTASKMISGTVPGYSVDYTTDTTTGDLEVRNTHDVAKTSVSVKKSWVDDDNQDGIRPEAVVVTLYINGVASTKSEHTVILTEGKWSHTFTDLPVHHGIAVPNIYTVVETGYYQTAEDLANGNLSTGTSTGYTATTSGDAVEGYTITNTHESEKIDFPVSKVWDDANDQDRKRPANITVNLLADGTEVDEVVLSASNNWTHTFTGLAKNKDEGTAIVYTLAEDPVDGYTTSINQKTGEITNSYSPEVTSVTATKVWDDANNQDGKRPEKIVLHLLANGHHTGDKRELNASTDWKTVWTGLPKYENGELITYTIQEEAIGNGYSTTYEKTDSGYTFTNAYTPETTSVNVWKQWIDNNDQDDLRPDSIVVTLYQKIGSGEETSAGKSLTLTAADNWMGGFTNLPRYANGQLISYSVKENAVSGYTTVITGDEATGYTISNTHETEKTSVKVSKVWDDENDRDGSRPTSITVNLHQNGEIFQTAELNAANGWAHTFTDLDVHFGNGTDNIYTVSEVMTDELREDYTPSISGDAATGYTITNTHAPETVSIPVSKVWNDKDDQDGIRPTEVTVALLADGVEIQTYTLKAEDNWTHVFADLQMYAEKTDASADPVAITYTVAEKDVAEGYTAEVTGDAAKGYTITNTHEAEVAQLNVQKVWSDFNNNDGKRPYAVVITLHENGLPTANTLTLSDSNSWKGVWADMPRFHNGQRISYSVVETGYYQTAEDLASSNLIPGVPDGYSVTHSYDTTDTSSPTATVTNTYTPETTGLNVQKLWDDDNNREGKRPSEITVTLYRKVGEDGTWEVMKDSTGAEMTTVLTASNDWDADFIGIPKYSGGKYIYYNVVESPVEGYGTPTYSVDTANNIVTITNPYTVNQNVSIAVSKVWDDNDDQDGIRPESVTVTLYANGIKTSSTKVLNEANGWKAEWTGLYEYYHGQKIHYTVEETEVSAGYTAAVTGDASTGYTITNTHIPETVSIPVSKVWNDNNNQDGKRPASITVTLLRNGTETGQTLTLDAESLWQNTFTGLDKYSGGELITYSVLEAQIEGYNLDVNGQSQSLTVPAVDGKITITNTHAPEKTQMTAIKVWDDNNDQDGKRPDSITLHLMADGIHLDESYKRVLSEETDWTATWTDLDKYSAGQLIRYTVYEEPITFSDAAAGNAGIAPQATDGYSVSYVRDSETQITVTNSYTPETTSISAIKVWEDDNNRDGLRPASITVSLLANGQDTGKTLTLNESNGWADGWTDLPVYENHGTAITYTVEEISVPVGYESSTVSESGTFTLTNTHAPETTGISVTKIWNDEDDNDGMRPDGIIVQLYADGTAVENGRVTLDETNQWTHTFLGTDEQPLYVYNQGNLISYYVTEVGYVANGVEYEELPDGYEGSTDVDETGYVISITNTHATEKRSLTVNKVWNDEDDNDGMRPDSVEVTLLRNGTEMETVVLNEDNSWTHTWTDLYKYAGGVEVEYTVQEAAVKKYTTAYAYDTSTEGVITATVTNTHEPITKRYPVKKIWNDNNDAEDLRPTSVTVQIYRDGKRYGDKIILSEKNDWKAPVELRVYENGRQIKWTIKELSIPRYYTVSYDQKTLTVTNTIQSREVPKTGDYNNLWLWIGLLGICSGGAVSVLFLGKKKKTSK